MPKKRRIPVIMATQHPDNARNPFWQSTGFVSAAEELEEAVVCFRDLSAEEVMWDFEGKYADEAVVDKLFSKHYAYFRKHLLGKEKFLTFRLPNVWKEKGYSLIRTLMVILTSEDIAHDLKFKARPLFEVILPMTERPEQLMYIQKSFQKLAHFKSKIFTHRSDSNTDHVEIIPLIEGVEDQLQIATLLTRYVALHKRFFHRNPTSLRPFLGLSDPALLNGLIPRVLACKVALSEIHRFGKTYKLSMYPIVGGGALVFRGGLSPTRARKFVSEYRGARTVTVQSAFRYDYPMPQVKKAILYLRGAVPKSRVQQVSKKDLRSLHAIIDLFSRVYRATVIGLLEEMRPLFAAVPKRRERREQAGRFAYHRYMGKHPLPRAIDFSAAWYSIGIPPEFIGLGRSLEALKESEMQILKKYYIHFEKDLTEAGRYLNRSNVEQLAKSNPFWRLILKDVELAEKILGVHFGPKTKTELLHSRLTSRLLRHRNNTKEAQRLIEETGKLRRSLG
ncbi:MAG: phosphoenolpyruvate carboxylase [bacterium]|nr:phosphoenolpyruvate carboxylase [bacterium]